MSQQLPLPGSSYPPSTSTTGSGHQTSGPPMYGYYSHQQLPPPHSRSSQHSTNEMQHQRPSTQAQGQLPQHSHSNTQAHQQAQSHASLSQHHLPPPQMQPPPAHSRQEDTQPGPVGTVTSVSAGKPPGNSQQILAPFSKIDEATGRKYQLDVVQQPRRARMCGFGDKDRRPITPPPCVRLIITDIATGKEIDCNDIDHSMFVLNVDLWSDDGTKEVNLVRSSTGSPSISSTTPYSYTTLNGGDAGMAQYTQHVLPSNRDQAYTSPQTVGYVQDYQMQGNYGQVPSYTQNSSYGPPQQYFPHHHSYRPEGAVAPLPSQTTVSPYSRNGSTSSPGYVQDHNTLARMAMVGGQPQGMFTRNLIGSLAASAFRLSDTTDRIGIWFVLQDLSVRTEGPFRLRFSFVNVGPPDGTPRDTGTPKVNKSRAPILACCFSDTFNVYSAKKFPGVCESTPLSKTFATQGIKIPIRKDSNVKGGDDDDYGD
ncbi:VelB protein [Pochonia chlamydosporia 170]|uniref:VelB protein n=1 Tax=Pochonia chlamydosporia 170 TaxID=1380566 RepID=A0A179FFN4_METCM|nr:VelB protein [Pochonia chlamydosporia 170]OAQ64158.1 VelB protein [Pochonia chlamydosporia 170]